MDLDRDRIERVVRTVADRLTGDWLLVGGALVAVWLEPERTTEDVDLVSLAGTSGTRFELLELAEELGLPVEALNSAADFFVQRIPGWRDELEVLHRGRKSVVYRPSPTLFLLLKIRRLSARDLADCMALLDASLPVDASRVLRAIKELPSVEAEDVTQRREELRKRLLFS